MKKVIAILILVFTGVSVVACSTPSEFSDLWVNDSSSEMVFSTDSDETLDSGEETDSGEKVPDSSNGNNSGGNVVKPITGGGDFNAGKDY